MNARPGKLARVPSDAGPGRMASLFRLPVFLALDGRRAMVAGGSPGAAWKAELLSAAGARVDVYAESASDELLSVASGPPGGAISVHQRKWNPDDLRGCALAIGACDNDGDAEVFATAARAAGVPVNVIDKPAFCDFSFGSIVNRSPLVIGISTGGAAPIFAQTVRAKLEMLMPRGFARWAAAAVRWRSALREAGLTFAGRRKFWQLFTAHAVVHPDREPDEADLANFLADVRDLGPAVENGSVTLVGAGPGNPELLTLRALRALQSADVVLFDDQVSSGVIDFARREAKKMLVGKNAVGPTCGGIKGLAISFAKSGKHVVRLMGDDPMLLGRAGEEVAACKAAGVAAEVVPGITAAQGGPAGRPLRHWNLALHDGPCAHHARIAVQLIGFHHRDLRAVRLDALFAIRGTVPWMCAYAPSGLCHRVIAQFPSRVSVRSRNLLIRPSAPPEAMMEANSSRRIARSLMVPLR
jgi:uroporphyrin-III C-methyltransferase/precorrin-2 dehydrogenase/sirohydrochlorin ferrochelatase